MPTETPPPYFPQNPLSPGDEKTAKKMRLAFLGCILLAALGAVGALAALVLMVRALMR